MTAPNVKYLVFAGKKIRLLAILCKKKFCYFVFSMEGGLDQ